MQVPCKKTLYWHQEPGYSGTLSPTEKFGEKVGVPVLIAGNEYEIVAKPSNNCIDLYAIGTDGRSYCIMHDDLHFRVSEEALVHFGFHNIKLNIAK